MKANITLALYKKIPVVLLALLNNVIEKLTGNIKLPTPPVSLTVMQTLADAYEQAVEDAQFGSQASKAARNALTKEVRAVLTKTGNYVRATANGDATILTTSGFEMSKIPEPVGLPDAPENLKVLMGPLSGQTDVRWKRVHGATSYQVLRSASDPTVSANWTVVTTTSTARFVDSNLESFKPYWYAVVAIGFAGKGNPCAALMGRAA
ncbi:MAG: fibronectin type III domain-containing protein [Flavobacteriales bacterium]|nr:fibronectin type III domain-containing protein [Flavobacteriales bacterium]